MKRQYYFIKSSIWPDLRDPKQQVLYLSYEELKDKVKSSFIIMLIPLGDD